MVLLALQHECITAHFILESFNYFQLNVWYRNVPVLYNKLILKLECNIHRTFF